MKIDVNTKESSSNKKYQCLGYNIILQNASMGESRQSVQSLGREDPLE